MAIELKEPIKYKIRIDNIAKFTKELSEYIVNNFLIGTDYGMAMSSAFDIGRIELYFSYKIRRRFMFSTKAFVKILVSYQGILLYSDVILKQHKELRYRYLLFKKHLNGLVKVVERFIIPYAI